MLKPSPSPPYRSGGQVSTGVSASVIVIVTEHSPTLSEGSTAEYLIVCCCGAPNSATANWCEPSAAAATESGTLVPVWKRMSDCAIVPELSWAVMSL